MTCKKHQRGVTLIEAMLVLVISAALTVMGLRMYQSYRDQADIDQLNYNIDTIMQALSSYYRANCFGTYYPRTSVYIFGALRNASGAPVSTSNPVAINISLNLNGGTAKAPVYLTQWPLPSRLIDQTQGQNGYIAQLNPYTTDVYACAEGTNATGTTLAQGCNESMRIGTVVLWKAQVSVMLNSLYSAETQAYMNRLGATCLTSTSGQGTVSCGKSTSGNYIAWERAPMSATEGYTSGYTQLIPMIKSFTQMYRTDSLEYLLATEASKLSSNENYIYCTN